MPLQIAEKYRTSPTVAPPKLRIADKYKVDFYKETLPKQDFKMFPETDTISRPAGIYPSDRELPVTTEEENPSLIKETLKAIPRGFENLAAGIGATTKWIGDISGKTTKRDYERVIANKMSEWGKNASDFWREEAQRGIEAPNPEIFKGSFIQNPSWTRATATMAESIPSLAGATAVSFITGNPLLGAASLGLVEGSEQYMEAREAGKSVEFASKLGALSSIGNTILEVIPLTRFLRGGSKKLGKDIFIGAIQEGGEEALQAIWNNSIAKLGYDKTRSLADGMIEGFIAGAGSGGVLGGITSGRGIQVDNLKKEAIEKGITENELEVMQNSMANQIINNSEKIENILSKSANWIKAKMWKVKEAAGRQEGFARISKKYLPSPGPEMPEGQPKAGGLPAKPASKLSPKGEVAPTAKGGGIELQDALKSEFGIDLRLRETQKGDLKLDHIVVPKGQRKQGIGSEVMKRITDYADKNNLRIVLTTAVKDDSFGTTSASRLKTFYKRFGFVENKGKDYSISENMLRNPKPFKLSPKAGGLPSLKSVDDVENLIKQKSKEYGSRNTFLASNEYKNLYPQIKKIYTENKGKFIEKGQKALRESGVKAGDRVSTLAQGFGGGEEISGTVIMRDGIPYVNLDTSQMTSSGYRKQVRWHKGWQPFKSSELQPLYEEARKYKSAEEFVGRKILNRIEEERNNVDEYAQYAIRKLEYDDMSQRGDILKPSKKYEDGEETDVYLEGTSGIIIKKGDIKTALNLINKYSGDKIAIIKGKLFDTGEDINEVILQDATIVDIFNKVQLTDIWNEANKGAVSKAAPVEHLEQENFKELVDFFEKEGLELKKAIPQLTTEEQREFYGEFLKENKNDPSMNLFKAIKELGGIKSYSGGYYKGELKNVPLALRNNNTGRYLDDLIPELKSVYGWSFEDQNELLDAIDKLARNKAFGLNDVKLAVSKAPAKKNALFNRIEELLSKPMPPSEVKPVIHKATGITKLETPVETTAEKLLKDKLKMQEQGAAIGFREGWKRAREKTISDFTGKKLLAKEAKQSVVDYLRTSLPPKARGIFINSVKSITTTEQAAKTFARIDSFAEKLHLKDSISAIKNSFKEYADSPSIAVDYRNKIKSIVSEYEFTGHSKKTIDKLKKTQKYFETKNLGVYLYSLNPSGEDVTIPQKLLSKLSILVRTPKENLTIELVEKLQTEIDNLAELGKMKWQTRQELYNYEKARRKEKVLASVRAIRSTRIRSVFTGKKPSLVDEVVEKLSQIRDYGRKTRLGVRSIDGFAEITGMTELKNRHDINFNNDLVWNDDRFKIADEIIKKYGLKEWNFDRIGNYAIAKNEGGMQRLIENTIPYDRVDIFKNADGKFEIFKRGTRQYFSVNGSEINDKFFSKQQAKDKFETLWMDNQKKLIENLKLSAGEKELADFILKEFKDNFPVVEKIARERFNVEVLQIENYVSFHKDSEAFDDLHIWDSFGSRADEAIENLRTKKVEKGFIEERKPMSKIPLETDIMKIFTRHFEKVSWLVNMGEDIQMDFEIVNSPEVREELGEIGSLGWLEWLDLMARRGGTEGASRLRAIDIMRKNLSVAVLPFRLSSALVQVSSFADSCATIGVEWASKGAANISFSPEWRSFIMDNFPEIRKAIGDDLAFREFGDTFFQRMASKGLKPLTILDGVMRASSASGAYEKLAKQKGIKVDFENPDKDLVIEAQKLMRNSQGSSFFKDQPLAITTGFGTLNNRSLNKTVLQFQSFMLFRAENIARQFWREGVMKGKYGHAAMSLFWFLVVGGAIEEMARRTAKKAIGFLIGDKEKDDEEKSYRNTLVLNAIQNIPFVGQIASAVVYGSTPVPILNAVQNVFEGLASLGFGKKPETKIKGAMRAATGLGSMLLPLPGITQAEQIGRKLFDAEPKKNYSGTRNRPVRNRPVRSRRVRSRRVRKRKLRISKKYLRGR